MRVASLSGIAAAIAALTGWSMAPPAAAQGFDAQRFAPAAGTAGGIVVERPLVTRHLDFGAAAFLSYARNALVVSRDGDVRSRPLEQALTLDLVGSIGLADRLELAAHLPLHAIYEGDDLALGGRRLRAGSGLGDVRLVAKAVVLRPDDLPGWVLGVALPVTLPTGDEDELRGGGGVSVEPRLIAGWVADRLAVTVNGGFRARLGLDETTPLGHEVTFGVGGRWALQPDRLDLLAELVGAWDVSRDGRELTDLPVELYAGAAHRLARDVEVLGGLAFGLTDGLGTPDARLFVGVRWAPRPPGAFKDTDGDGVSDERDACPTEPEDPDRFEDDDGCAELDNDRDTIPDELDECPDDPEEPGGDGDGCPERGRVIVREGKIFIIGKVLFETGSADIKQKSYQLLDGVAVALGEHPEIRKVEIQGHTDDTGDEAVNERLSQARADAVRRVLIERGVAEGRLTSRGYGESRPIAPNTTAGGRAKNRRVEFVVVD